MTIQDGVIKYLDQANLMQIATFSGRKPWCTTVFYAVDNLHNLYWLSPTSARHSREIAFNDHVAAAITVPHSYGQGLHGLQVEGIAELVTTSDIEPLFQAYAEKYNARSRLPGLLGGTDEQRLYKLIPDAFVLYDEENFPTEPRQEWRLDEEQQ